MNTREVQAALLSLGFDPGPVDGISGAKTRAAIKAFQKAAGIPFDGIAGPKTWEALARMLGKPAPVKAPPPPWFEELLRRKGLHEVKNRSALMAWLRSDGKTLGDPAKLPWCGDAIQTCLALTLPDEPQPVNPYLARNWLKIGVKLETPVLGCILVFWRGSKAGSSGHVGLYAGEDGSNFIVLGGNQSDSISLVKIAKSRLLGARWPSTYPLPRSGPHILTIDVAQSSNEI